MLLSSTSRRAIATATWTAEPTPNGSSILDVAHAGDGSLVAVDYGGNILRRAGSTWSTLRAATGKEMLVSVAADAEGHVVAAGPSDVFLGAATDRSAPSPTSPSIPRSASPA